ncbi:MAG: AbrB/MazE/SpoVT family DNA-binding domain-containing protein [Methanomicrobiaceae archaeon]|uniref:Phosphate regulatory protein n=1 Tax=hydrocarbon metagenome TaxID=938273 RepID=A0A0W8FEF0_9ZZZZ|nr:AbrB/MazE/SpoVT family DNA-binding domain-containing protein [Methanomicrobiaceae archaeon]MDD5418517.1 PhoU domain-containing protein [Methanomicrobiaceae archaeon]
MEIRKIQLTGGSSYIVSLPKEWIKAANIQKNDPVGLLVQPDGSLVITPKIEGEPAQRIKEFAVDAGTDRVSLLRCLIGAYIAGYTTIRICSRGRLPPFIRKLVREFTQMAVGQEVVHETEDSITLKDLLNPVEMPLGNTIKRMSVLARGMQEDAVAALSRRDRSLAEDVITRDNEVDRLHWLIARQNHLLLKDLGLSRRMNLSAGTAAHYYLISRILERIADHAARMGWNALALIDTDPASDTVAMIDAANASALFISAKSMESVFEGNLRKANETIKLVQGLDEQCKEISARALQHEAVVAIPIGHMSDSIRRIGEYSADICENVINYVIGEEA